MGVFGRYGRDDFLCFHNLAPPHPTRVVSIRGQHHLSLKLAAVNEVYFVQTFVNLILYTRHSQRTQDVRSCNWLSQTALNFCSPSTLVNRKIGEGNCPEEKLCVRPCCGIFPSVEVRVTVVVILVKHLLPSRPFLDRRQLDTLAN